MQEDLSKKEFLESVTFKVVNAEKNQELLNKVPHRRLLDLAAIYVSKIPLPCKDECSKGYIAMAVNWDIALSRGLTEHMLYEAAKRSVAVTLESLDSFLAFELFGVKLPEPAQNPTLPLYIVTNEDRFYGAAALVDVEVFRKFAENVNDDLFILPSSVHELMVVPASVADSSNLKAIVGEANQCVVTEEEKLSDNVYLYSRETNTITISGEEGKTAPVNTEAVETCPYCECDNVLTNWDVSKQGYIAKCWNCGKELFLCDECLHSDDNPKRKCDWHEENGCGRCFRGITKKGRAK